MYEGIHVMISATYTCCECPKGIHDLGNRVDAYVEQLADKLDIRGDNILVTRKFLIEGSSRL
jgi:hypothetical protein